MRTTCPTFPRVSTPAREPLWGGGATTLDESIPGMRIQVIRRAVAIGVSAACQEAGISGTLFYLGATSQSLWRRGVASASSGCSRRLSLSTGGWSSAASTSPVARRSIAASAGSWSSTTSNGRIMDIGPWADPGDALSRRGRGGPLTSRSTLGRRTCQHQPESGQSRPQ